VPLYIEVREPVLAVGVCADRDPAESSASDAFRSWMRGRDAGRRSNLCSHRVGRSLTACTGVSCFKVSFGYLRFAPRAIFSPSSPPNASVPRGSRREAPLATSGRAGCVRSPRRLGRAIRFCFLSQHNQSHQPATPRPTHKETSDLTPSQWPGGRFIHISTLTGHVGLGWLGCGRRPVSQPVSCIETWYSGYMLRD
jgi:hypothetical protein